jgi:hypothetical protein
LVAGLGLVESAYGCVWARFDGWKATEFSLSDVTFCWVAFYTFMEGAWGWEDWFEAN